MGKTKIEWTRGDDGSPGETWNPTRGCRKISPGCKHCYAETFAERWIGVKGHAYELGFKPRLAPDKLDAPLHWKAPRRIFVNSMSDLFLEDFSNEYIAACFGVMATSRRHTYQILTKRATERLRQWFDWIERQSPDPWTHCHYEALQLDETGYIHSHGDPETDRPWPLPNVWLGVSVESPDYLSRLDALRSIPAAVRFVSFEPLLADLGTINLAGISWSIVGGESGPSARPMHPAWARSIREQCHEAHVPFFFKQWGAWAGGHEWAAAYKGAAIEPERIRWMRKDGTVLPVGTGQMRDGDVLVHHVGKKSAGRILDGRTWDEFPSVSP